MAEAPLFLIAHKVRGELAFDVASQIADGTLTDPGPWWIIPTSGHRAYPFWSTPLLALNVPLLAVPGDLRDHYAARDDLARRASSSPKATLSDLA